MKFLSNAAHLAKSRGIGLQFDGFVSAILSVNLYLPLSIFLAIVGNWRTTFNVRS